MWTRLILLSALFGCANSDAERPQLNFAFPSELARSESPDGTVIITYQDVSENPDEGHDYEFIVRGNSGTRLASFIFLRSVAGAWSPSGRDFFVNNYIGSNVTDCLVSQTRTSGISLISLTELLARQRENETDHRRESIAESPDNSHFYLTCSRWTDDSIDVSVRGYTDETRASIREFAYNMRYLRSANKLEFR